MNSDLKLNNFDSNKNIFSFFKTFLFILFNYQFQQDLKQFNITYEEITDKVEIGRGRFGTVYK